MICCENNIQLFIEIDGYYPVDKSKAGIFNQQVSAKLVASYIELPQGPFEVEPDQMNNIAVAVKARTLHRER